MIIPFKSPKRILMQPNNIVSLVKQYCFTCQTQVFDESNNIVSFPEHLFLKDETLVLAKRYNNFHSFTSSLFRMRLILKVWYWMEMSQTWSLLLLFRLNVFLIDATFIRRVAICILRIAREGPFYSPTCILVRKRAFLRGFVWRFDKMVNGVWFGFKGLGHLKWFIRHFAWCGNHAVHIASIQSIVHP